MWSIEVTLDGCPVPYELCRCVQPDAVAAVVLALCRAQDARPVTVRRLPADPQRSLVNPEVVT